MACVASQAVFQAAFANSPAAARGAAPAWVCYDSVESITGDRAAMFTRQTLAQHRAAILEIAHRHGAHDLRVFGSVARGDAMENSDLDLVVRFDASRSLMDHAALIGDLEDLLGIRVDVIDADGMRPRFRAVVEREAVPL